MYILSPAPASAPLSGTAARHVECRSSSRTTLVLLALLAHVASAAAPANSFSGHLQPMFAASSRGDLFEDVHFLAQQQELEEERMERTAQPKTRCMEHSDCSVHARCTSSGKCAVAPLGSMPHIDISMCLLAFVIAGFSLAAGVGGGGLYVPLLMFILSFDARAATALSQAMLFGGAFAAFIYNIQVAHPSRPKRPLINFELALLMAPALMGGAQVGSVLHALAPSLATLLLLLLVLGDAARKGVHSAMNISAKEAKTEDEKGEPPSVEAALQQQPDENAELVWQRSKSAGKWLLLIWALCIALIATKGAFFEICSPIWWIMTFGSAVLLSGLSWMFAGTLSVQEPVDSDDIDFRQDAFPLVKMSILAGAIAALCGIGGGMVMGPILVELKVPPPISAATTATTLVVLSTSTLLIYVSRGIAPWDYAILLSCFTMIGAAVGKVICGWWVRRTGKQSIIVWILAGVTVCSMLLLGIEGTLTFIRDPPAALAFRNFCQGHVHHTVPMTD